MLDRSALEHIQHRDRHLKRLKMTLDEFQAYAVKCIKERSFAAFNRRCNLTVEYEPRLPRELRVTLTALTFIMAMLADSDEEFKAAVNEALEESKG